MERTLGDQIFSQIKEVCAWPSLDFHVRHPEPFQACSEDDEISSRSSRSRNHFFEQNERRPMSGLTNQLARRATTLVRLQSTIAQRAPQAQSLRASTKPLSWRAVAPSGGGTRAWAQMSPKATVDVSSRAAKATVEPAVFSENMQSGAFSLRFTSAPVAQSQ